MGRTLRESTSFLLQHQVSSRTCTSIRGEIQVGLFGKKIVDTTIYPTTSLSGIPQAQPEAYGGPLARRQRLFWYTVSVLKSHPQAHSDAFGNLLGDGLGMEGLVETIRPIYSREASLLKWVALRGALHGLWDSGATLASIPVVESVGLRWLDGGELCPADPTVPQQLSGPAVGLAASVMEKVGSYEEISELTVGEVQADQRWRLSAFSDEMALDYIVWSAIVLNRLEAAGYLEPLPPLPQPSMLEVPGWYVDPLWGRAGRYWDGSDWTTRWRPAPDDPRFRDGESSAPI